MVAPTVGQPGLGAGQQRQPGGQSRLKRQPNLLRSLSKLPLQTPFPAKAEMSDKTRDSSNKIHGSSSSHLEISNIPSPLLLNNPRPTRWEMAEMGGALPTSEGSWICRRCWRGVQTTRFRNRHLETRGCFRDEHMGGRGGRGLRRKRLGRQRERPWQRQQRL